MSVMGLGHMNIWGLYWKLWTNFFLLGFTIHVQGMFLYLEHIFVWIKQGSVTCCKLWENEVRKTLLHFCVQIGRENLLIKLDIFIFQLVVVLLQTRKMVIRLFPSSNPNKLKWSSHQREFRERDHWG